MEVFVVNSIDVYKTVGSVAGPLNRMDKTFAEMDAERARLRGSLGTASDILKGGRSTFSIAAEMIKNGSGGMVKLGKTASLFGTADQALNSNGLGSRAVDSANQAALKAISAGLAVPSFAQPQAPATVPGQPAPAGGGYTAGDGNSVGNGGDGKKVDPKKVESMAKGKKYSDEEAKAIAEKVKDVASDDKEAKRLLKTLPERDDPDWKAAFGAWYADNLKGKSGPEADKIADDKIGHPAETVSFKMRKPANKKGRWEGNIDGKEPARFKGKKLYYDRKEKEWYDAPTGGNVIPELGTDVPARKDGADHSVTMPSTVESGAAGLDTAGKVMDFLDGIIKKSTSTTTSPGSMADADVEWNKGLNGLFSKTTSASGDTVDIGYSNSKWISDGFESMRLDDKLNAWASKLPPSVKNITIKGVPFCKDGVINVGSERFTRNQLGKAFGTDIGAIKVTQGPKQEGKPKPADTAVADSEPAPCDPSTHSCATEEELVLGSGWGDSESAEG